MKKRAKIEGMTCGHCVASVTSALQAVEGITNVNVDLEKKTATVETGAEVSDDAIGSAVKSVGYSVTSIEQES